MGRERWQPPPMKQPASPESAKPDSTPKVTVDENVVRKMLKVNPTLRQGRTTSQVKKSLERGEAITTKASANDASGSGTSSDATSASSARNAASSTASARNSAKLPSGAAELRDTVTFFLRSKLEALTTKESDIAARRAALDAELAATQSTMRDQVRSFLALLDQSTLAQHGPAALADHTKDLARIGLDAKSLIDEARRGAKK